MPRPLPTQVHRTEVHSMIHSRQALTPRGERAVKSPLPGAGRPRNGAAVLLLRIAVVAAAALGAAVCDWKTPRPLVPTTIVRTPVDMQDQHGEFLGSKTFESFAQLVNILTRADVGDRPSLSSKYIALRYPPSAGTIGGYLGRTNSGSLPLPNIPAASALRAIYMSTVDLPESVMDCFYNSGFGQSALYMRKLTVGRVLPGADPRGVKILDGDESILTNAIDDINAALVDRQGVTLGKLSWRRDNPSPTIAAGFATEPMPPDPDPWGPGIAYVLVDPTTPRSTQIMTALGGFLESWGNFARPCGKDTGSYLADPAMNYRLSKQGVSIIRFGAYLSGT